MNKREKIAKLARDEVKNNSLYMWGGQGESVLETTPKDINPWWQCPFNMSLDVFITWTCELLVNRDDRELLMEMDDEANTDRLYATIDEMLKDGILEKKE